MPDYEIKEWNEDNFPIDEFSFAREAYDARKWAFVADVCRFYALIREGGIYLDTDVEVFKPFDRFLNDDFFSGTEIQIWNGKRVVFLDGAAFGCKADHWLAKRCLEYYKGSSIYNSEGKFQIKIVEEVLTNHILPDGYEREDKNQEIKGVKVYDTSHFSNITQWDGKKELYSLHHFDGSWNAPQKRGLLYKLFRKFDMIHIYRKLEKLTQL